MNYRHVLKMIDEIRMMKHFPMNVKDGSVCENPSHIKEMYRNVFADATAFDITNVAEFVWARPKAVYELTKEKFPCLRLPFSIMWLEYKYNLDGIDSLGILCRDSNHYDFPIHPDERLGDGEILTEMTIFAKYHSRIFGPITAFLMHTNRQGELINYGEMNLGDLTQKRGMSFEYRKTIGSLLCPGFYAIQFLNCKNVVTETKEPPQTINERHRRKHPPLVTYRILRIDRGKHYEGVSRTTGLEDVTRYHICRGHFKHYSEDKPLFGKFVGTYWWEAHARGNKELGEVIKDYEVAAS